MLCKIQCAQCRLTSRAEPQPRQPGFRWNDDTQIHNDGQTGMGSGCWLQRFVRHHTTTSHRELQELGEFVMATGFHQKFLLASHSSLQVLPVAESNKNAACPVLLVPQVVCKSCSCHLGWFPQPAANTKMINSAVNCIMMRFI